MFSDFSPVGGRVVTVLCFNAVSEHAYPINNFSPENQYSLDFPNVNISLASYGIEERRANIILHV